MKKITISKLEKHFVQLVDQGSSPESLFNEFASIVGAKFIKFKYRYPDSFGALISKNIFVNLFHNTQRNTFGFQVLDNHATVHAVLSSHNSDSTITDTIMRLSSMIGHFSHDIDLSDLEESASSSSD